MEYRYLSIIQNFSKWLSFESKQWRKDLYKSSVQKLITLLFHFYLISMLIYMILGSITEFGDLLLNFISKIWNVSLYKEIGMCQDRA